MKSVAILGHPLAATENRLAFFGWRDLQPELIAPDFWPVKGLGTDYQTSPSPAREQAPGIQVLACRLAGRNSFFLWRKLEKTLDAMRPSLLYCWEEPWCLATLQARLWAQKRRVPMVFYSAENRPKRLPVPFRALAHRVFATSLAAIVPTEEIAANLAAMGFSGRILGLPLWLAPRKPLKPNFSGHTLAYVGRLIPLKRVDLLIRSLLLLPGFRLRVIGDGPERKALQDLARETHTSDRVDFVGYIPNAELEKALEGCGGLVLPTAENEQQAEQFGKAALEAVLCGLPVLVSNSGHLPRWSQELSSVRVLADWSPESVAKAILELWNAPPDKASRVASRLKVWEHYGAESVGRRMEKAFLELLEETPR